MINEIITQNFLLITLAGFFLGLDKGGFRNLSVVCMYLLLLIIPSKQVIGILAPIYLIGDILPIYLYRKDINFNAVKSFTPLALGGIIITSFFASFIDDKNFTLFISFFILLMVVMVTFQEVKKYKNKNDGYKQKPISKATTLFLSLLSGITTVSNAAGAITSIYFLRKTDEKKEFVGSTALFFITLNITKVIIFTLFWKNINLETLKVSLSVLPGMIVGLGSSIFLVKVIPQKIFNIIIIISVYYIAIMLLVENLM